MRSAGSVWLRTILMLVGRAKLCPVILDQDKLCGLWLVTMASIPRRAWLEIVPVTVFAAPSRGGVKRLGQCTAPAMRRQDTGPAMTYLGITGMMHHHTKWCPSLLSGLGACCTSLPHVVSIGHCQARQTRSMLTEDTTSTPRYAVSKPLPADQPCCWWRYPSNSDTGL
ncbi:hypothetical protein GGR52DRAFT_228049 [Hypoxylon sp. FL1284]|nr:hypothetical protein GGR52DRAFT_228049 [Hypoxylon sp. FL1284]